MKNTIVITKNGATFLTYTEKQYKENKHFFDNEGYRKATNKEVKQFVAKGYVQDSEIEEDTSNDLIEDIE